MIHSMSGGVLSEYGSYTFVKIVFDGEDVPRWYISDIEVQEGDRVSAPYGSGGIRHATVMRVERNVSGQVSPVPVRRARKIIGKLQ